MRVTLAIGQWTLQTQYDEKCCGCIAIMLNISLLYGRTWLSYTIPNAYSQVLQALFTLGLWASNSDTKRPDRCKWTQPQSWSIHQVDSYRNPDLRHFNVMMYVHKHASLLQVSGEGRLRDVSTVMYNGNVTVNCKNRHCINCIVCMSSPLTRIKP